MLGHCSRRAFAPWRACRCSCRTVWWARSTSSTARTPLAGRGALLETLAAHLAGAIEAFRLAALERESAVAQERSLLASELHDSIAQSLSFLKLQVGRLHGALQRGDRPQLEATLAEVEAGVQESLADVRELLLHFRTRTNNEDIAQALRATLHKFELQTGLTTHLSLEGQGLPLGSDVQIQVLHIVQEALSNVRKHAQAREVWVEVERAAVALRDPRRWPGLRCRGQSGRRHPRGPAHHARAGRPHRRPGGGGVRARLGHLR
jgi:two-component system nitrate/nitrite sensor histidine kinase NarX